MTLLDRLLGHDAWTTGEFLRLAGALEDSALDREFDIAHRTVRRTLDHIIWNMEAWSDAMAGRKFRDRGGDSIDELRRRLMRGAADLRAVARDVERRDAWDEVWSEPGESPPVERTLGGAIAHVVTHSMHHRAQLLYMLRRLGVEDLPEGDVLSWEALGSPGVGSA